MKTRRTLAWGMAGLALVLALAGCVCTRKALPDVEPTAVGGVQTMDDDAQATALVGTANARATQTAQAGAQPDTAEGTSESPLITPTVPPPTDIPPTGVPPTDIPAATSAPAATTAPSTGSTVTYVVQRGDTLYSLARRYGTTVEAIATANGIANPNQIRVGQTLTIPSSGSPPPPSGGTTYVVQPGDNLFRIALRYNMSYLYLASYNGITDPSRIYVGQVLRIP